MGLARFRLFIDGSLVDEEWIQDPEEAAGVGARHTMLGGRAHDEGRVWLAEIFFPGDPPETAYTRFGTDEYGMSDPRALAGRDTFVALDEELRRHWGLG